MSQIAVTVCDGCDATAYQGYLSISPRDGWMHLNASLGDHDVDVCSWECLATVVARRVAEVLQ